MTTLRGNKAHGYRTVEPVECPACSHKFALAGTAADDKQGPHLVLWPVQPKSGEYSEQDLDRIYKREGLTAAQTGVAFPAKLSRSKGKLPADPVPAFDGPRGA